MSEERAFKYMQMQRPFNFLSPFCGEEFVALLFVTDESITKEEQERISDEIVAAGCRFAVCGGYRCGSWDDSIDEADLKRNGWVVNEDTFVMTTWHENESIEDIVFCFMNLTSFDAFVPKNFLTIVLGDGGVLEQLQREISTQLTGTGPSPSSE